MVVTFRPIPGEHGRYGDLTFELGSLHLRASTYYYALDHFVPGQDDAAAIRRSLTELLRQWLERLTAQPDGATLHLPYHHADLETGVIVVTRDQDFVHVHPGTSDLQGVATYPTNLDDFDERLDPSGVEVDEVGVRVPRAELLATLKTSLDAIASAT